MTLTLSGPTGNLEALYTEAGSAEAGSAEAGNTDPGSASRCALLCHPHPQFGGSMHDGVLGLVADAIAASPAARRPAHLRFNFRGVGASAGSFDNGVGEQDDLVAAWNWLAQQDDWEDQLLIGYSFGAAIAWAAQTRCVGLSRLVLIAPPSAAMPFDAPTGERASALEVHSISGSNDSYVDLSALPNTVDHHVLEGADHFFSGHAQALQGCVSQLLDL